MNIQQFEDACKRAKLKIVDRDDYNGWTVVIADGYANSGPQYDAPHYCTAYAVGPSVEDLKIMQRAHHPWGVEFGLAEKLPQRVNDAKVKAKKFIDMRKDGGILRSGR